MDTHNLDLDIIQQKQMIDNLPMEDLMKNIQIYLKENIFLFLIKSNFMIFIS